MVIPNIWPPSALSLMWTEFGRNRCLCGQRIRLRRLAIPYPQDKESFMTNCAIPDSAPLAITRATRTIALRTVGTPELKVDDYPSTDRTCDFVSTLWDQHPVFCRDG